MCILRVLFEALTVAAISIASGVDAQCYQDWVYHEESCYGVGEERLNWPDSQEVYDVYGARLAEVENAEEALFIKTMLKTRPDGSYWIGGTDIFHEGVWDWASQRVTIYPFMDWRDGEPNNGEDHEDCVAMDAPEYTWNDWECDRLHNFVCETEAMEPVVG